MASVKEIMQTAEIQAHKFSLDPDLVLAICQVESNFKAQSARYEKRFIYVHDPDFYAKIQRITLDTETNFQKTSWGIMQLMGGTARWIGFGGWIPDLSNLETGLEWGCRYLQNICDKYITIEEQMAAYNAGSPRKLKDGFFTNQEYVNKVRIMYLNFKNTRKK